MSTSSWHLIGSFPTVVTLGQQQYHVGEKPTVILKTYNINRHAGMYTLQEQSGKNTRRSWSTAQFVTLGLGSVFCFDLMEVFAHIVTLLGPQNSYKRIVCPEACVAQKIGPFKHLQLPTSLAHVPCSVIFTATGASLCSSCLRGDHRIFSTGCIQIQLFFRMVMASEDFVAI